MKTIKKIILKLFIRTLRSPETKKIIHEIMIDAFYQDVPVRRALTHTVIGH